MLKSRITPCLLLQGGGLVKTKKFADPKYVGDPINAVKIYNEKEVDELSIFDIDATANGRGPDFGLLKSIAVESRMPLCYGGGVSTAKQAADLIAIGYEKVSVSAAAISRPDLIKEMADAVGRQSVCVTFDVRKAGLFGGYSVFTHNGRNKVKGSLIDLVKQAELLGAGEIVINCIDRDGMMQGYDLELAKLVRSSVTTPMSVVGGAGSTQHMRELIDAVGTVGACAGSMFVFKGQYRAVLISYARP